MRSIAITAAALAALALTGCGVSTDPTPVQAASPNKAAAAKKKAPAIKLAAKHASADKSILSDGGALSCVRVTVTNHSKKNLEVNPLYFSITDTKGTKHDVSDAIGDYKGQIGTTTLAPGENAKGMVCGAGKFMPKVLAMTNELLSEAARAEVS